MTCYSIHCKINIGNYSPRNKNVTFKFAFVASLLICVFWAIAIWLILALMLKRFDTSIFIYQYTLCTITSIFNKYWCIIKSNGRVSVTIDFNVIDHPYSSRSDSDLVYFSCDEPIGLLRFDIFSLWLTDMSEYTIIFMNDWIALQPQHEIYTTFSKFSCAPRQPNAQFQLLILQNGANGQLQERRNSIANALELCLSCTNPSICELICG